MAINLDFIKNLLSKKQTQDYPMLPLVQANEQGGLQQDPLAMAQAQLGLKQASTPLTVKDRLFGREMTQDYQTINPDTNETEMTTISNYRPGFFNDLASGYRENATQGFDVNNLAPQRKSVATRIGEGLGTLARFYDKPIGRMAVATGLSMLTDEANSLGEGVKAYVGRQTNMTKDKAYRQNLQQMGYTQEEIDSIPGIMSDDIYTNLIKAKELERDREYRRMYLDTQNSNQETLNNYRMAQLAQEIQQNQIANALKSRGLDIQEQRYKNTNKLQNQYKEQAASLFAIEEQLNNYAQMFEKMPGKAYTYTVGKAQEKLGLQDPQRSEFDSRSSLLFNKIARDLGGEKGVLSDQDIARVKESMPKYTDSLEQKKAKMKAIYDLLNIAKQKISFQGGYVNDNAVAENLDPLGVL